MKTIFTILITAVLAISGTWFFKSQQSPAVGSNSGERKVLFYQSPMHPWIKSDKPGRCTICGMELTPIYAGEKSLDSSGSENVVTLSQSQIHVLNVQTAEAKIQSLTRTLQVAGTIDDDTSRHRMISAYIDGRVEKLYVNFMGAEVTEGQPIVDFYSPSLLQAEREYRQLSGSLKISTALRLRQMGLNSEQIEALSNKPTDVLHSQILAPIGGTVVGQNVYEGQYVSSGEKLFEIADFSTMWFQFLAYEQDLPWLKIGQSVSLNTPSLPGKILQGQISFIDPNFDEVTHATKVRVELANPLVNGRRELLHKLYADGAVKIEIPAVLAIPRSAIIQTGPVAVSYLDQGGGAYTQIALTLGRRGDSLVEVISGLKPGDKVVSNGNLLIDGQAEINRSFSSSTDVGIPMVPLKNPLSVSQQTAIRDFALTADAMAAALATDDLEAFTKATEASVTTIDALADVLKELPIPTASFAALDAAKHFHELSNLQAARTAFLKFTLAGTALLEPLRTMTDFPEIQIYECPMTDQAIPDSAKKSRWVQIGGRPIGNPFFGKSMLTCGKEIKP